MEAVTWEEVEEHHYSQIPLLDFGQNYVSMIEDFVTWVHHPKLRERERNNVNERG